MEDRMRRRRGGWVRAILAAGAALLLPAALQAQVAAPGSGEASLGPSSSIAAQNPQFGFLGSDAPPDATADLPANSQPPRLLALPPDLEPPSIYAPRRPPTEADGVNMGGVDTEIDFRYLTDDVYRGVSHDRASGGDIHAFNYQASGELTFNLGKLPHPFVGVFANINDSDPLSRFQEIRPFFGLNYTLRPLIFDLGYNTYIYPERERLNPSPNTSEVYLKVTLDDSFFFLTPRPILSPYVYGAYDYQRNKGWYLEAGVKHDIVLEDFGFTLTPQADVGYISHFAQQFVVFDSHSSGFQHYDVGIVGSESLNYLFKLAPRYGQFNIEGYLTYTGRFGNPLLSNSVLWGGVGVVFKY
jgi:hypothetical protein